VEKRLKPIITFVLLFFLTLGFSQITVLSEDFNGSASIPSGWTQENVFGNAVWSINNGGYYNNNQNNPTSARSGSRNAYLFAQKARRKLVSPPMNLSGKGNIQLNFFEARLQWGGDYDSLRVYYKTSASGNWVPLNSYNSPTTNWTSRNITLPNPSSTYYIAFEARAHYGYGICIDDITITAQIAYDAGIENIRIDDKKDVMLQFKNWGANSINSVKLLYQIDGGTIDTFNWSGNVASGQVSSYIKVGTKNFAHGLHTIKAWTSNPDNQGDGDNTNDTMSAEYFIINYYPYVESFENGDGYWEQPTDDNMNWTRKKGSTITFNTGPGSAYDGNFYYYMESSGNYNKTANFVSPDIDISKMTNPHLEFHYHMYGSSMGELHVDVDTGIAWRNNIFAPIVGNQGDQWHKALISLDSFKMLDKIRIRGITGGSFFSDIAIDDIKIIDIPDFSLGNDSGICLGNSITLSVDTGYGYTFTWIDTTRNDTVSYTNIASIDSAGTYYLRIDAPFGYFDEDTIDISIFPLPNVSFTVNDSNQCLNENSFNFQNQSNISSGTLSYLWHIDQDTSISSQNLNYVFSSYDTVQIKLLATSELGCSDSSMKEVVILESPSADFLSSTTSQCYTGNLFSFTDNSSVSSTSIDSLFWDFGDGATSHIVNPSYSYTTADSFIVELVTKTTNGCSDTINRKHYVRPMPSSSFKTNYFSACQKENDFVFTNLSSIAYGSLNYSWDFGDQTSSTSKSPNHIFADSGLYTIQLFSTSEFNCKDTVSKTIRVNPSPASNFSVNSMNVCLRNNEYDFTNQSSISSGNMNYVWDFGDGTSDTATNTVKSYQNSGTFDVKLLAVSDSNCRDSLTKTVSVFPMPEADFSVNFPEQCFAENSFSFDNQSTIPTGTMTYFWNFDDGNTTQKVDPMHSYLQIDTFVVSLVATSNQLCRDTTEMQIIVHPEAEAKFTIIDSIQCFNDNEFIFNNLSKTQTGTLNYKWYFGETDSSEMNSPTYYAKTSDTLKIKLFAFNNGGCIDSAFSKIVILENPKADFVINDSEQCLDGNKFIFTSNSTDSIIQHNWNFGEGNLSFVEKDSNQYQTDGTYKISLVVTNNFYCKDSITKSITVFPQPLVSLGKDTLIYNDQIITLDAGSGFISYDWNTADTTQTIDVDGSQTGLGFFDYWVAVTDQNNCSNSDTITIEVQKSIGIPEESFTYKIFPNPTSDKIYIKSDNYKNESIEVFLINLNGQILYHNKFNFIYGENINEINMSSYNKGGYLLKIVNGTNTYTTKIIKQ
jgi:PKD repeat protein